MIPPSNIPDTNSNSDAASTDRSKHSSSSVERNEHDTAEDSIARVSEEKDGGKIDIPSMPPHPEHLPPTKKEATSSADHSDDDVFLDNIPTDYIEEKVAMSDHPMNPKENMKHEGGSEDNNLSSSSVVYDLGSSPPKLPSKISRTAQKLFAHIPSSSLGRKEETEPSTQIKAGHAASKPSHHDGTEEWYSSTNGDISNEEFHALRMKVDSQKTKILELEEFKEKYDRRVEELEASQQEMLNSQQEMYSLISSLIPLGTDDAANPRDPSDSRQDRPNQPFTMRRSLQNQPARNSMRRSLQYSVFNNYHLLFGSDDNSTNGLENDTFALMMLSNVQSRSWALGIAACAFQIVLGLMVFFDQFGLSAGSFSLDLPFKVDNVVRVGQFCSIILCLSTQSDILTSINSILVLGRGSNWDEIIGERGNKSNRLWLIRVLLPNLLKLMQGLLVITVSFVIIVQSENIIVLLKDFTALMVLSETDNILFQLARYGYLGRILMEETAKVSDTVDTASITANSTDDSPLPSLVPRPLDRCPRGTLFCFRLLVLLCLFATMFGCWVAIVLNQINGDIFNDKYPNCTLKDSNQSAFELAKQFFGDGKCYGGPLNSLECAFEGGDCIDFNLAYPLCKGDDLIDVQKRVGNGTCESELNKAECEYDGGDCDIETRYPDCTRIDLANEHFGDGICYGGPLNTLDCAFEGGDCANFNMAYPLCKGNSLIDVEKRVGDGTCDMMFAKPECDYDGGDCCTNSIINSPLFGDGQCHGEFATAECGFDNGDCNDFIQAHPACPLSELRQIEGASNLTLGNGICDSGVYSSAECGWKHGDCNIGQKGQKLDFPDILSFDLSLDGNVIIDASSPDKPTDHQVEVYHYNESKMIWGSRGSIPSRSSNEKEGLSLSVTLNQAGDRVAVGDFGFASNAGQVKIFEYISSDNAWAQMGQTIQGPNKSYLGSKMDMTGDGSRLVVSAPFVSSNAGKFSGYSGGGKVFIYEFNNTHQHWDLLGNAIEGRTRQDTIGLLFVHISALDGDTVILSSGESTNANATRIFRYNHNRSDWVPLGSDIPSPSSHDAAMSSNGNRIAVSSNVTEEDAPGQVHVYDYDGTVDSWILLTALLGTKSRNGNGFGYSMALSNKGTILSISSVDPKCDGDPGYCATGNVQIYVFDSMQNDFIAAVDPTSNLEGNMIPVKESEIGSTMFGSHLSISGDGSTLSIGGYNFDENRGFVNIYALDQIFYLRCFVDNPDLLGDGWCIDQYPYNSEQCGFDGGDCLRLPVEGYPGCLVSNPGRLGNGFCQFDNLPMYNSTKCDYDGGDCLPKSVDGYPGCYLLPEDHYKIGNGECDSWYSLSYNTTECGYDGGDCLSKPIDGYPGCYVPWPEWIGDGLCDSWYDPSYNTTECGYDGGDCLLKLVQDGYPGCYVPQPDRIGNGECDSWDDPSYNSTECGYDGGDCLPKPVDGYPGCYVHEPDLIDDGHCDYWDDPSYNSTECGYDGGDCLPKPVDGYPGCSVPQPDWIGNGQCDSWHDPSYNSTECGYDGGDCLPKPVDGYPGCYVPQTDWFGNGYCDSWWYPSYNTTECGYDGGDCLLKPVHGYPGCSVPQPDWIGDGHCHSWHDPSYNTTECDYDGGDCLS